MFRNTIVTTGFALLVLFSGLTAPAQDIGFIETFALSADRAKALEQLVPGTQEFYYFHSLHYLNTQQYDKVEELAKPWKKRFGDTQQLKIVLNRLALLQYDTNAEATLKHIRDELNLYLNHQREIPQAQRGLPSVLDQELINPARLIANAMASRNADMGQFTYRGLDLIDTSRLDKNQLRQLLARVNYPDFPNLVGLILRELKERDSGGFGSIPIHNRLTLKQLIELATALSSLNDDDKFIQAYLRMQHPSEDVDMQTDRRAYREYLTRLWATVENLNPKFNSLKANVLYNQLDLDRRENRYDENLFKKYLSLPRQVAYVNPELIQNIRKQEYYVNLSSDFRDRMSIPPINTETELVEDYLDHFFRDANDFNSYRPLLRTEFLKQRFATAKILAGKGDGERWASMLSPEAYKALVSRVDLKFSLTNPEFFSATEPVELEISTKNVDKLIVKVFEINTFNYYRKNRREIDTDINLDGLVPNLEQTYSYDDPPAIVKNRKFTFDEITKPGVYVVDFIGNGKSSRSLIRIGQLSLIESKTIAGHAFRVIDHSKTPLKDFNLWISGRRYQANKNGFVVVPYSNSPGRVPVIINHQNHSCLDWFQHASESYQLQSAIVVDRESLLRSEDASLLIRPMLSVAGIPADTKLLSEIQVQITTTNLDGISASKTIEDVKLGLNAESTIDFVVPPRLMNLRVTLSAKVENISQASPQSLSVSKSFTINQIDKTDEIQDVHLIPHAKGYSLEVLGKTGESRPKQAVKVTLFANEVNAPINVDLQSDENGFVALGELKNIRRIETAIAGGSKRGWDLTANDETLYTVVHSRLGDPISFTAPADMDKADRGNISLFEVRKSQFYDEHFDAISLDQNEIIIRGLTAGNYVLRLKHQNRTVSIRVSDAKAVGNVLVGDSRRLEQRRFEPMIVNSIEEQVDKITLKIKNANDWTRVHVVATRFAPRYDSFVNFNQIRDVLPWSAKPAILRSVYMSGRKIGDEYKYILDRKYASKYPGNMLDRPTLLLNPWMLRETNNQTEVLDSGNDFGIAGADQSGERDRQRQQQAREATDADFANLDFLADGSRVITNLKPDKDGVVAIDREKLGGRQHVRFFVTDAYTSIVRTKDLDLQEKTLRDLRLANVMDPDQHFSQTREVEIVKKNQTFEISDILSAKFQYYDDLGDVYLLLNTINANVLQEFEFVLKWPTYDDAKKNELYSKYACHELNFFLLQKDLEFFNTVVKPHIAFKRDQTFMDHWLLGADLQKYTQPRQYNRLNTFEKILLSQRLESSQVDIARHINEHYQLNPTRRQDFGLLFDSALASAAWGEDGQNIELRKARRMLEGKELPDLAAKMDAKKSKSKDQSRYKDDSIAVDEMELDASPGGGGGGGRGRRAGRNAPITLGVPMLKRAELSRKSTGEKSEVYFAQVPQSEAIIEGGMQFVPPPSSQDIAGGYLGSEELGQLREESRAFYRRLKPTEEWIENNYWHIAPDQESPELVQVNRFWRDYAAHRGGTFLSPYFAEANKSFTETMFALAVLDLPFEAPKHTFEYADARMTLNTAGPMIAMHQQVQPAIMDRGNTSILVSENFFQKNDRYRHEDNVRFDKFLTDDFVAHTLYGGQVVVTNPTSTPQAIDILIQIPQGAVVASGSQETQTIQKQLDAFSTQTYEYFFYFPTAGQFTHFPSHVAADEKVLAVANPVTFLVIDRPAKVDKTSWAYVSQNGTDEDVIKFLNEKNILRLNLEKIAFRMKDKAFFTKAIQTLRERFVYNHTLWSYAVLHNDRTALTEFLDNESRITSMCGPSFHSSLLTIDPVDRRWYFHREYTPLVNARVHEVGKSRKILNPEFREQYLQLMHSLANQPEIDSDYQLVVTYYLLLQDRIDEAMAHFDRVDQADIESRMQYDYCDAYLDMYRAKPDQAAAKAQKWASYPVDHWRKRFQSILAQVEEIQGGQINTIDPKNTTQSQTALAADSESFDFDIQARKATVKYQNIGKFDINYYEMDIELLFSRSPFAQDDLDGFSMIRPNLSDSVTLEASDDKTGAYEFEMPAEFRNKNVLVEIVAGDQAKSKPYFANSLSVQIVENYGHLKVTSDKGTAISKTYVKVYTRDNSGQIKFHKDGYTDLRGRFDYVSQSNNTLDGVQQYSILILHPEFGAIVRQVDPPKE